MDKNDEIIYQVVRGERPCTDLKLLGVEFDFVDDARIMRMPYLKAVKLRVSDVANGLVKYHDQPKDLQKWARFMLMASNLVDFDECEKETGWDVLLNALWDAMGNGTISENALHRAEELAK